MYKNDEKSIISVILTTDLSSAYDTVNIDTLLQKLNHYGVRGDTNKLFRSYFSNRKQFVRLENFSSIMRNSPMCSVVQGSKMSGFMYNVYTNEIPLLHKLINTEFYRDNVNKNNLRNKKITHETINFVDDSTNIIGFSEHNYIKIYIENYYKLLEVFYNANKLQINSDKTKLLIVNKPKLNKTLSNFSFRAGSDIIKADDSIKILGTIIQKNLQLDKEIGKLSSQLYNRINNIRKLTKFTSIGTRLKFLNGFVMGKLNYMLPLYCSTNKFNIDKLHKIVMTAARTAIGSYCFKKSTTYILDKCGWLHINNMIIYSSLNIIHNVIKNKLPISMTQLFRFQENTRSKSKISLRYTPKNNRYKNFYICKYLNIYNEIPNSEKAKSGKSFKQYIKNWIRSGLPCDTND